MIKVVKKLIRLNQLKDKIYEDEEELIDYEDGNIAEIKKEYYQGHPTEKTIFEQFIIMEKEKNQLLQSSALDKSPDMTFLKQYIEIRTYRRLKALQKKLLGEKKGG